MAKYPTFILVVSLFFSNCFADTFTHRRTGESFNGYVVQRKKGNKTQVRIEKRSPQYLNLSDYKIQRNRLGRKNRVFIFSIEGSIDLICETEAFEKWIATAANQGPLFILIEIDTPGGRVDLAQRICAAITQIDNCTTVAFVSGGKFGGAYSVGSMIALACDELYMADSAAIGAVTTTSRVVRRVRAPLRQPQVGEFILPDRPDITVSSAYIAALAERNNRPGTLAKAMVDKDISVLEVSEDGKTFFIEYENRGHSRTVVRTWSRKRSLLTLTATEATQCGIADKVVSSRDGLFDYLAAAKAAQTRSTDCRKARRGFEKAKKEFEKISPAIMYLEQHSDKLLGELNSLESRIRRHAPRYSYRHRRYGWYLEEMLIQRETLMGDLLSILKELVLSYKNAVRLAREHLDINADIDSLVEGMNSAVLRYNELYNRPM